MKMLFKLDHFILFVLLFILLEILYFFNVLINLKVFDF